MTKHFVLYAQMVSLLVSACACGNKATAPKGTEAKTEVASDAPAFDADSAYAYVKAQVDFGPRVPGSKGHTACGDYIVAQLKAFGADTVIEQKSQITAWNGDRLPIRNIMARYNTDAQKRVLLMAHWDTRPWADEDPNEANHKTPVPGANDGASGVGVLLEVARQLQQKTPDIGVDLLMVDTEDYGKSDDETQTSWCLGTQYWVNNMPYSQANMPMYGVLLDMVGGKGAQFHREYFSHGYASAVVDRVWAAAKAAGQESRFVNSVGSPITDDHVFVNQAGIPTIDIIECNNAQTGSFPPTWHTVNDDMRNIDTSTLKAVGQTLMELIYSE